MKKVNFLYLVIITIFLNLSTVSAQDCSKLKKLSKEYAECNSNLIKKKTEDFKNRALTKIDDGKNKFNKLKLKEKLIKFKNSKNHKEFLDKIKNDS